jgi:hypothetical protein
LTRRCNKGFEISYLFRRRRGGELKAKDLMALLAGLGEEKTIVIEDNQGNYYDILPQDIEEGEEVIRVTVDLEPAK